MSNQAVEYFGVPPAEMREKESRFTYTATANQTTFSATYTVGYVDVYRNGIKLDPRTAFTATNGTVVTLTAAAASGDIIQLICRKQITDVDSYSRGDTDSIFARKSEVLPVGGICLWSGTVDTIPTNWALCNGTNGTPNLLNRFVVGAGDSYATGITGGANFVTLAEIEMPSHTHGAYSIGAGGHSHYVNDPGHSHGLFDPGHQHASLYSNDTPTGLDFSNPSGTEIAAWGTNRSYPTTVAGTGISVVGNYTGIFLNGVGDHTHGIGINYTGGNLGHENRPPYYALAYIMRIA